MEGPNAGSFKFLKSFGRPISPDPILGPSKYSVRGLSNQPHHQVRCLISACNSLSSPKHPRSLKMRRRVKGSLLGGPRESWLLRPAELFPADYLFFQFDYLHIYTFTLCLCFYLC